MENLTYSFQSHILGPPHTIFQNHHSGTFHVVFNPQFLKMFVFGCVLKPEAIERAFQNRKS